MPSASSLGKRKRTLQKKVEEDTVSAALEDAQAIFKRHFEAQFAPIQNGSGGDATKPGGSKGKKGDNATTELEDNDDGDGIEDMRSDSESGEEDDEWGGLSGEDDSSQEGEEDAESDADAEADEVEAEVEVVDYSKPLPSASSIAAQTSTMTKREMRAYLSSRPPDSALTGLTSTPKTSQKTEGDDDPQNEDSKSLLANDLALQRLISESHILSASNPFNTIGAGGSSSSADGKAFTEGRIRKRTTDLRLQKLGSKESIFTQRKMPMNMRKWITATRDAREEKRRREARENGIILEKPQDKSGGKKGSRRSKKGHGGVDVDMPGMGKFKNGELRLSQREVRAVEMEGMRRDTGGKRKRKRR